MPRSRKRLRMPIAKLVGLICLVCGVCIILYSLGSFANNLLYLLFWPFLGLSAVPSADQVGTHASWALISLFVGTPLGYILVRVGWTLLSGD